MRRKTSPHSIALGFSIGTLIGILPTPGFGFFIGLLVVLISEKINKVSLFAAILFWNPIVLTPIYFASYAIGDLFFGPPVDRFKIEFFNKAYSFSRNYLVGNLILAVSISILSYFIVKWAAAKYYGRKSAK